MLRNNPLMGLLAAVVFISSTVAFGMAEYTVLGTNVSQYVSYLLPGSIAISYFMSMRNVDEMENYETAAMVVPIAALLGSMYLDTVHQTLMNFQPISGVVLSAVSLLSFYVIVE
jgi:hypothetical protein